MKTRTPDPIRTALADALTLWLERAKDQSDADEAATAAVVFSTLAELAAIPEAPEAEPQPRAQNGAGHGHNGNGAGKKGGKGGGFPQTPEGVAKVLWYGAEKRRFVRTIPGGKEATLTEKQAAWLARTLAGQESVVTDYGTQGRVRFVLAGACLQQFPA